MRGECLESPTFNDGATRQDAVQKNLLQSSKDSVLSFWKTHAVKRNICAEYFIFLV